MKIRTEQTFSAAHSLFNKDRSPDWNEVTYGKCGNLHGHNWKVVVEIEGDINEQTGMIVNFNEIKKEIDYLDHKYLNALPEFTNVLITAENLAKYLAIKIKSLVHYEPKEVKVRVYESEKSYAEYTVLQYESK